MSLDCNNRKKYNLTHNEWVLYQFDCGFYRSYKNVFLHTSFLEGLILDKSQEKTSFPTEDEREKIEEDQNYKRGFRRALKILKEDLNNEYRLLHKLYDDRNKLIHSIARLPRPLDQDGIESIRDTMWKHIIEIYKGSDFINNLFIEREYGFSPREKLLDRSDEELARDT